MRTALLLAVALVLPPLVPSPAAAQAARELILALVPARPGLAAEAALGARLDCLGLTVVRTLADGLPAGPVRAADAEHAGPFSLDPARVWLIAARDSMAAR